MAFDVRISPVFIKYEKHKELTIDLDHISDDQISAWTDDRLVGFADTYRKIETTPQFHQDNLVIDPVCGMRIRMADALTIERKGETVHFCEDVCRTRFNASPAEYADLEGHGMKSGMAGLLWPL